MSSMIDCMKRRVSVRTYDPAPLSSDQNATIAKILKSNSLGPFGTQVRLELVDFAGADKAEAKKYGTYGFIRGAHCFIAGAVADGPHALLDFGYCFEKTVLELTDVNFGTCWMALTYNEKGFLERMNPGPGEALVAVSPVGVPSKEWSVLDRLVKALARPRNRKPWDRLFFETAMGMPLSPDKAGSYGAALECVRLAPSGANYQPWRIVKASSANVFHFFTIRKGARTSGELHAGIAMCNFGLAASELGLAGTWNVLGDVACPEHLDYCVSWMGE
jgi:nitroreductase